MAITKTDRLGLNVPDYAEPRWDIPVNENWNLLDDASGYVPGVTQLLEGIDTEPTAVFIYNTANDSDGGAWRKNTAGASWYQEELNTNTRGNSREFPAIVAIVAEVDRVTIFDLADPDLAMWMVFLNIDTPASVSMINGELYIAKSSNSSDFLWSFTKDSLYTYYVSTASTGLTTHTIAERNGAITNGSGGEPIISYVANDVSMTILDTAPIDPGTDIAVPTIALATNSGVSIINGPAGSGTVVDITSSSYPAVLKTAFIEGNRLQSAYNVNGDFISLNDLPSVDETSVTHLGSGVRYEFDESPAILSNRNTAVACNSVSGTTTGLTLLAEDTATPANGMVNYITNSYQSGWMQGDIRLATLADTTEEVIGTDTTTEQLDSSGLGTADILHWVTYEGAIITNPDSTTLLVEAGNEDATTYCAQGIATIVGQTYSVSVSFGSAAITKRIRMGTTVGGGDLADFITGGASTITFTFKATTTTSYLRLGHGGAIGETADFTGLTIKAVQNRVENGEFSSDRAWTLGSGWTIVGGVASADGTDSYIGQEIAADTLGECLINVTVSNETVGTVMLYFGNSTGVALTNGPNSIIASSVDRSDIRFRIQIGFDGDIDNISVIQLQVEDRCLKDNTLQVVGQMTKAPVASGSELVAYSGFSATDYIKQPYTADIDRNTNDMQFLSWVYVGSDEVSIQTCIMNRRADSNTGPYFMFALFNDMPRLIVSDGNINFVMTSDNALSHNQWYLIHAIYYHGVGGEIFVNGVLDTTYAFTDIIDSDAAEGSGLTIGTRSDGNNAFIDGKIALVRVGIGAPSTEQIAKIYADEVGLFNTNTQCTISGLSVNDLSYDKDKEVLHVATNSGVDELRGLVKTDTTLFTQGVRTNSVSVNDNYGVTGLSLTAEASVPGLNVREELLTSVDKVQVEAIIAETTYDYLDLNSISSNPGWKEARIFYDNHHGALSVYNNIADFTLNVGQESVIQVVNASGATILNGEVCRFFGAGPGQGHPQVTLAQANTFLTAEVLGVATHDIPAGEEGYITSVGVVHDLDTSGFVDGETAWLSDTVEGEITNIAPDISSRVGQVLHADPLIGTFMVNIENLKSIPTVVAFMNNGLLPASLTATPVNVTDYTNFGNVFMTFDPVLGTITVPTTGIYSVSATMNFTHSDTGNNSGLATLTLSDGTAPALALDFNIAKNSEGTNMSVNMPFNAVAGITYVVQVSSSLTLTGVVDQAVSFSMESVNVR